MEGASSALPPAEATGPAPANHSSSGLQPVATPPGPADGAGSVSHLCRRLPRTSQAIQAGGPRMSLWVALLPPHAPRAMHRDATVAVVGFTSWAAVAGKILSSMSDAGAGKLLEALLALGAALLCLWPLALTLACPARYARWREFLIPVHLAVQHWIGLHFSTPLDSHAKMGAPGWVRGLLPVFLASFCQPWLYLAFGACLQRTRLRTFLWTQPLLLAPMLWTGHSHCSRQLAATPEAAAHVARIAAAMRQASTWLPVGTLPGGSLRGSSGAAAAAVAAAADTPQAACLSVHLWLVLALSFCLPAIVIHRLEGQELQAEDERKQELRQQRGGDNGGSSGGSQRGGRSAAPRQLLLQQPPSLLRTAAELLLAAFTAWQVVHVVLLLVGQ